MRTSAKLAGALFLMALATQLVASAQNHRETDADDVREAVVRYQIKTWYLSVDSYCISVSRKSARKEFLSRFTDNPKVKPASACAEERRRWGRLRMPTYVTDKQTRQPAVVFDVGAIRWLSDDTAEVRGSYYCAFRCWAGITYQVARHDGAWTVEDFYIEEMSSAPE